MTGKKLFETALSLLMTGEQDVIEYKAYLAELLNVLLAETFEVNNSIRLYKGKQQLFEIYKAGDIQEELPCEDELCSPALAYGLCARLLYAEDDLARMAFFQNQYVSAVEDAKRCISGSVIECRGEI